MVEITPSQLITINLKFSNHAKPLKLLAFADLASNALFTLNRESSISQVATEMARLLGLPNIEGKLVEDALNFLHKNSKVSFINKKWKLTDDVRGQIKKEKEEWENVLDGVLKRHFPQSVKTDLLKNWFLEAASDFFGFNGAEWVKAIAKTVRVPFVKPQTITGLLRPSMTKAGLASLEKELSDAFEAFLSSDNPVDLQYIMNLGFAMFSAKLAAVDVGADPILIDEIKGSTLILDTNALYATQLDGHRLAKSIFALAKALKEIDVDLFFLHETKQEYTRVFIAKRNEIAALFREYPADVVFDTRDGFIESAVARGCKTAEDFDRFFETIKYPPNSLSPDMDVKELDDQEINKETIRADADQDLKDLLQKNCLKLRPAWDKRPKSKAALRHDVSIVYVVEMLRKSKSKTWILSLDRGLRASVAERAGAHSIPPVLMLDGLIQILAVHSGGPSRDASDFAPLLTNIILNRCAPSDRTYTIQDLQWLHSVHQRVVDLSSESIKKIANIIVQQRIAGVSTEDPKLQLAVNRAYQGEKVEYDRAVEEANEKAQSAQDETRVTKAELTETKKALLQHQKSDCLRRARKKLILSLAWRIPVAIGCAILAYFVALWAIPSLNSGWLDWIVAVLAFLGIIAGLIRNPVVNYKNDAKTC